MVSFYFFIYYYYFFNFKIFNSYMCSQTWTLEKSWHEDLLKGTVLDSKRMPVSYLRYNLNRWVYVVQGNNFSSLRGIELGGTQSTVQLSFCLPSPLPAPCFLSQCLQCWWQKWRVSGASAFGSFLKTSWLDESLNVSPLGLLSIALPWIISAVLPLILNWS